MISELHPPLGPTAGETQILITADHAAGGTDVRCRFAHAGDVPAVAVADTTNGTAAPSDDVGSGSGVGNGSGLLALACVAPRCSPSLGSPGVPADVTSAGCALHFEPDNVTVSLNGQQFSNVLPYVYYPPTVVTEIYPKGGGGGGGSRMTVHGDGFQVVMPPPTPLPHPLFCPVLSSVISCLLSALLSRLLSHMGPCVSSRAGARAGRRAAALPRRQHVGGGDDAQHDGGRVREPSRRPRGHGGLGAALDRHRQPPVERDVRRHLRGLLGARRGARRLWERRPHRARRQGRLQAGHEAGLRAWRRGGGAGARGSTAV